MAAVAVSDDLGNVGGSLQQMTAGDNVGDDVGNDVGDGDEGSNNAGNAASNGGGSGAGGEGKGGLLAEDMVAVVAAAMAAVVAAYCRGCLFFIRKIFMLGIFLCVGGIGKVTPPPHTLVMLEVCRHTFGWGR